MRAILTAPCRCGRHECGSRIKELAEALKLTPGRVVQLVDELEADGTASRVERGVKITSAGLDLVPPEMRITAEAI